MTDVSPYSHLNSLMFLPIKAVQVRLLDGSGNMIAAGKRGVKTASGLLRRELDGIYLYSCWHVATGGIDPHNPVIPYPGSWIRPEALRISLQAAEMPAAGVTRIGGSQSVDVPLYDAESSAPAWAQDRNEIPHDELNRAGFRVPATLDVIKLRMPNIRVTDLQSADDIPVFSSLLVPGDKLYVVGFPYGYSSFGDQQPTAIVLTRFVAAVHTPKPMGMMLLDAPAAPGMSGGPVFLERDGSLYSTGVYTGEIYPEQGESAGRKDTALGTFAPMMLPWLHPDQMGLVAPSPIVRSCEE